MAKKKIGDLLIERGYITKAQLDECLREQALTGARLGDMLVAKGLITEEQLTDTISDRLSIPKVSLESMVLDPRIISRVPVDVARKYVLIPVFEIGNTLTLAMADPLNIIAIDEVKYLTGREIKRAVAGSSEIKSAIDQYYSVADSLHQLIGDSQLESSPLADQPEFRGDVRADSPVMKLVDLIISKAVKDRASDIHIEPDETSIRIRYRISGTMREEASPPKSMQNELISRIKVAANLDVSEKRLPQDGRFMAAVDGAQIDLRISSLPTIHGEKLVIRILDRRNLLLSFNELGFDSRTESAWNEIIRKPEGLVLISGPTSSGKTSTLYATLQTINTVEKNIVTVEDPVEYSLPMIIQVQINERAGLTFPSTLRAMLRQNPDIIMIGEIRDKETAQMAVRSALTGHLVFSTIHTNDAPSAVTRLIDMGIEPYFVGTALKGVLAQRLVRKNCPDCREAYKPSELILRRAGIFPASPQLQFQHGAGCPHCRRTGLHGQTGIYEFFQVNERISEAIMAGAANSTMVEEARRHGFRSLFEAGMDKVSAGEVCIEELLTETSNASDSGRESDRSVTSVYANDI